MSEERPEKTGTSIAVAPPATLGGLPGRGAGTGRRGLGDREAG